MKFIEKLYLAAFFIIFGGILLGPMNGWAVIASGFHQGAVSWMTNDFYLYYGTNAPAMLLSTNSIKRSNSGQWVDSTGWSTNDGTSVVSNNVIRGAHIIVPAYVNIGTPTNNDYGVANNSLLIITNCSTTDLRFTGFAGGVAGQQLTVINLSGTNMWIGYTNALSSANHQINLLGLNPGWTNTVGPGSVDFIYDGSTTNWILRSITY